MATDGQKAPSGQSLRRALGRTSATFLTAAMIIGTGLFAALGATAEKAGSGLLLAMIFSGCVALATGLSAASVGIQFPEEGGGSRGRASSAIPRSGSSPVAPTWVRASCPPSSSPSPSRPTRHRWPTGYRPMACTPSRAPPSFWLLP